MFCENLQCEYYHNNVAKPFCLCFIDISCMWQICHLF